MLGGSRLRYRLSRSTLCLWSTHLSPDAYQFRLQRRRWLVRQLCQQGPGLLEIRCVKPLGKPLIDLCHELVSSATLPLTLPETPQTDSRPELQRLGLLTSSNGQRLEKTRLGGLWQDMDVIRWENPRGLAVDTGLQQELTREPIQLRLPQTFLIL
jgi:hypothetical protein